MVDAIDLTVRAEIGALDAVHESIQAFSRRHDLAPRTSYALELVVDEFMTNVVEHGYEGLEPGPVSLRVTMVDGVIQGEIADEGHAFDPTAAPEPDITSDVAERAVGGLGVHLSRHLLDSLDYRRAGIRNIVRFRLTPQPT